jgi:predicted DNA-binding transcriptional regulator YafY
MTRKQLNAYEVIVRARNGTLTVAEAAEVLGVSERHIKRLKKKVKEEGAALADLGRLDNRIVFVGFHSLPPANSRISPNNQLPNISPFTTTLY